MGNYGKCEVNVVSYGNTPEEDWGKYHGEQIEIINGVAHIMAKSGIVCLNDTTLACCETMDESDKYDTKLLHVVFKGDGEDFFVEADKELCEALKPYTNSYEQTWGIKPTQTPGPVQEYVPQSSNNVHCPKCGSESLSANKTGFGLGKAVVGGIVVGPVGLLAGAIGSGKVKITCLKCGHQWKAGK